MATGIAGLKEKANKKTIKTDVSPVKQALQPNAYVAETLEEKRYEQQKEQERLEYMDVKEARDKKASMEQELAELDAEANSQREKAGTVAIVSAGIRNKKGNTMDALVDSDTNEKRNELKQEIDALGRDITLASRIQQKKYLTNRAVTASDFKDYLHDPEIEEKVINPHQQNIERDDSAARYMDEDQRAIYNYYYNKFGEEKAEEYLDSIREDLNREQAKAIFAGNEDNVLAQLALMAPTQGLEQSKSGFQGAMRMLLGEDDYQPTSTYEYLGQMAKEDLADKGFKLPEWMGGQSLGQVAYDFVNTTANMAPSIAFGAVTAPFTAGLGGTVAFGASAAGNAYQEKINEGYSKEQATTYGVIVGVSEATLEKVVGAIGFGGKTLATKAFGNIIPKVEKAGARIALKYGTTALSEGFEEGLQEVLEPLYRNIAFGESNGIEITEDAIYSALLGALSGGLLEGTPYAVGEISNVYYEKGIKDKYGRGTKEIIDSGLSAPADTEVYKIAEKAKAKVDSGERLSDAEIEVLADMTKDIKPETAKETVEETAGEIKEEFADNEPKQASETAPKTETTAEEKNETPQAEKPQRKTFGISEAEMERIAASLPDATKDTGKQIAAMYDPADRISRGTFIRAAAEAYRYGELGSSIEDMNRQGTFVNSLPEEKRTQAYYIGKNNAEAANIESARAQQAKILSGVKGKVIFEGDAATQIKNDQQRVTVRLINSVLKHANNMEYHVFASYEQDGKRVYKNSKGEVVLAPNGFYNPDKHQIWLDVNAGAKGQGIMLYTLTHEHIHDIKVWSAEHYNKLAEIVSEAYEHAGKSFSDAVSEKYAKYHENHPEYTPEDAQEEVIADALSTLLSDEKGLRELSEQIQKQDKSLWNRIKAWFNDVIARITAAYKGVAPESEEAKILMEQKELFEHAQKVFAEAIVTAGENYKNSGAQSSTSQVKNADTNAKFQDRNSAYMNAVNKGDMKTAQKLVDEAAKEAGYAVKAYHGTDDFFTVFNREKIGSKTDYGWFGKGFYFHIDADTAKIYGKNNMGAYLKINKLMDLNAETKDDEGFDDAMDRIMGKNHDDNNSRSADFTDWLVNNGYDGVAAWGQRMVLYPEQIKSADPITYDDNGNVIPLSERFKENNPDIRYSDRDYSYEAIVNKPDMKVTYVGGTMPTNRADVVAQAKQNAAKIGKYNSEDGSVSVYVDDVESDVLLGTDGLRHGLRRTKDMQNEPNYIVTLKAGEIIKNSIKINEVTPRRANASGSYVLIGAAQNTDGDLYIVRSVISRFNNKLQSMDVLYAINTKKEPAALNAPRSTENPLSVTDSTISIANLLDYVNKYFPDILPMDVFNHLNNSVRPKGDFGDDVLFQDRLSNADKNRLEILGNKTNRLSSDLKTLEKAFGKLVKDEFEKNIAPNEGLSKRAEAINEKAAKRFMNEVGAMFAVPKETRKEYLLPIINEIIDKGPAKSESEGLIEKLYNTAYDHTEDYIVDTDPDGTYKNLRNYIRKTPLFVDNGTKADVGDYNTFRKANMGSLSLTSDAKAIPLDGFYDEVSKIAPEVFSGTIDGAEQLYELSSFMKDRGRTESIGDFMPKEEYVSWADASLGAELQNLYDVTIGNFLNEATRKETERTRAAEVKDAMESVKSAAKTAKEEGVLIGQIEQGKQMSKEMRLKQEAFNRKAEAYEKAIAKKKELIEEVRTKRDELLEKAKAEKAEAVARVRKADAERMEKAIADVKARERAKFKEAFEKHKERENAIRKEYQESRKKATEGRHRTDKRAKIKLIVNELNQLLLHPTKERHVPEHMKGMVARALNAVDLFSPKYYEIRIENLQNKIVEENDPATRAELKIKINHYKELEEQAAFKVSEIKEAYEAIEKSEDPTIKAGFDPVVAQRIDRVSEEIGNTSFADMSDAQLDAVYDLFKMIKAAISNTNKAFAMARNESISEMGEQAVSDFEAQEKKNKLSLAATQAFKNGIYWNNLKPYYFFRKLGSKVFEDLFGAVRKGEDTWAVDINEASGFAEEIKEKYHYNKWYNQKNSKEFESSAGKKFKLTVPQMMSIYAYSKREDADKHLSLGGFVFDSLTDVVKKKVGVKVTYKVNDANTYNISPETILEIVNSLTQEQREFVDDMQKYLSEVMGEKGNEVSMAMYDIKLFKETNYFPLKSANQYNAEVEQKNQTADQIKLKNAGFTKSRVPGAGNPVVLSEFMDVWANHVNDMSMYHAFTLPIEDINRVLNYRTSMFPNQKSVRGTLENAFGQGALKYFDQFIKDINGNAVSDSRESFGKNITGRFKKAAVAGSLSVAIQQPSSIVRAFAIIDPKYIFGISNIPVVEHKKQWNEIKKYAPIAVIKEMGRFDMGTGVGAVDYIKNKKTLTGWIDDVTGSIPAALDESTWITIWHMVKRETKAKHKDLKINSEEFLKIAGERFTEVVVRTQVYDSTLSRSANMRSKTFHMNALTSFMAEPTTSLNMWEDAFNRKGSGAGYKAKIATSLVASSLFNSALAAFVYALRDDDEDESYWEKYVQSFVSKSLDGLNPLTYYPILRDIWSAMQGYDIERIDMSLFVKAIEAFDKLSSLVTKDTEDMTDEELKEHKKAIFNSALDSFGTVLDLLGVPAKNLIRDGKAIMKLAKYVSKGDEFETTVYTVKKAAEQGFANTVPKFILNVAGYEKDSKYKMLYDAFESGDKTYFERLKATYTSEDAYSNAAKAVIKKALISGEFSESQAKTYLMNYNGMKLDDAEGYVHSWSFEKKWGFAWSDRADAYASGQITESRLKQAVMEYKEYSADETAEAEKEVDKIKFKAKNGFDYSARRSEYIEGNITKEQLKKALMDVDGMTSDEADMQIKLYDLQKAGFEEVTEYAIKDYNEFCEPAGIPEDVYFEFFEKTKNIKGDTDSKGESIPYSKTKKIMPYIAELPLTGKQKTAVAKSFGWADSTIRKYRLW